MTRFAKRRFPDTIVRRRQGEGYRDERGRFVPGAIVETELAASVQPLALEDSDIAGGAQLRERLRVYTPERNALLAAFEDAEADNVVYNGATYVVEESRSWPTHTRATLLRES